MNSTHRESTTDIACVDERSTGRQTQRDAHIACGDWSGEMKRREAIQKAFDDAEKELEDFEPLSDSEVSYSEGMAFMYQYIKDIYDELTKGD